MAAISRVLATDAALALIAKLKAKHGPLMFHQSGGCCDGSSPMCYPEGDLLVGGDALVAKDHHMVIQVRAVNAGEILVIDRAGQIQADDLGPHAAGEWTNLEGLGVRDRCWNSRGG